MILTEQIFRAVQAAIADVNEFLPPEQALGVAVDDLLAPRLDSLGTVNLLLATESQMEQQIGRSLSLTDVLEAADDVSPLATVGSFVAFLRSRLDQDDA